MTATDEIEMAQEAAGPPTTRIAPIAPGESGVSILSVHFQGGAHLSGMLRRHCICFQLSPRVRFECRIGGRTLEHQPSAGSLAVCPAGIDWVADGAGSVDALLVAVEPGHLEVAATEESVFRTQLIDRLAGEDPILLAHARNLALESADGYPNGPLHWHQLGSDFIDRLVRRHTSAFEARSGARLAKDELGRIQEYVAAHLGESIDVPALARLSGRSPFHFSRVFTNSVGTTPHRYVVRLRLRRAVELLREGRLAPGEIALRTGFADQSHLSRWIRRVYGVTPMQIVGSSESGRSTNLQDWSPASLYHSE